MEHVQCRHLLFPVDDDTVRCIILPMLLTQKLNLVVLIYLFVDLLLFSYSLFGSRLKHASPHLIFSLFIHIPDNENPEYEEISETCKLFIKSNPKICFDNQLV